jgi:hypothetical protein
MRFDVAATLAAAAVIGACASPPQQVAQAEDDTCKESEPRLGTSIRRKERCVPVSEKDRDAARAQVERINDEQRMRTPTRMPGQ